MTKDKQLSATFLLSFQMLKRMGMDLGQSREHLARCWTLYQVGAPAVLQQLSALYKVNLNNACLNLSIYIGNGESDVCFELDQS